MKYLVAGLGNIGPEYELTRHNIGFLVLDQLADKHNAAFSVTRLAEKAEFRFKGKQIHMIKPSTYMNLSGKAVAYWLSTLRLKPEQLLIVVDDIALPFGSLRLRPRGTSAGHNGLKSIEESLGSINYPRLRFGIGNAYPRGQQADYVLSNFNKEEFDRLPEIINKACEMILSSISIGIEKTMSLYND
ncbi:MAG: aminoacyl-tRNA hydrolase [Cyclobacteriaceae bacterium]